MILDSEFLLSFIMSMDWRFGNKNANEWQEGYYGKFRIVKNSNINFYKKLIKNFKDIEYIFNTED